MKILLALTMLLGSTFAMADASEWKAKCYEREGSQMELAYIIKAHHQKLALYDCSEEQEVKGECQPRGYLQQVDRENESCLVLKHGTVEELTGSWSLCYEEQETLEASRLVPVTVTDDDQDGRIYCERKILQVL